MDFGQMTWGCKNMKRIVRTSAKYFLYAFAVCVFCTSRSMAQAEKKLLREGNKLYQEKKFVDAEVKYKKSMDINKTSTPAHFNLGDAYYRQGKFEDAAQQFAPLGADKKLSSDEQHKSWHNLGNAYLQSKKYEESVSAFKSALRINPKDSDTRYNLAYAQAMLKKDQQQKQQKQNQQQNKQ